MTSPSTAPTVTALAPETLQSWFKEHQDLVVIDVRSAAEFESMHIRGSYNVPLPLLSEHTDELAARLGSRVVLVHPGTQCLGSKGGNSGCRGRGSHCWPLDRGRMNTPPSITDTPGGSQNTPRGI